MYTPFISFFREAGINTQQTKREKEHTEKLTFAKKEIGKKRKKKRRRE